MVRELNKRSERFRRTGGTHSAMLCSIDGEVIVFAEDVGRHNAIDKVVGAAILSGVDLGSCVLVSSGRQSGEIVLKAARSGVPDSFGSWTAGIGNQDRRCCRYHPNLLCTRTSNERLHPS